MKSLLQKFIPAGQIHKFPSSVILLALLVLPGLNGCTSLDHDDNEQRIQPYSENPWYWQYKGEPVLLLGGSDQDNLFNHPDIPPNGLEAHLDRLVSSGRGYEGSSKVRFYVRNTMSSRDDGVNVWWFSKNSETGLYDLNTFDDEYWNRFENFLAMTAERDIIVQVELWDRFDFARAPWRINPFNPDNNINYTAGEIGLPEVIDSHPGQNENPFFRSVPDLENNEMLLRYQEAIVGKMLEVGLRYDHVLYCISNETNGSPIWSAYWARFIRQKANEAGTAIEVTEMWDAWDLTDEEHRHTFDHPDLYSFVDISQNSHQRGQTHWDNMQKAREILSIPRPMNTVKIYGGTPHGHGTEEGTRRMWRNIFGGLASSRFHRPESGAGLSDTAVTHLSSAYRFVNEIDVFNAEPANELLSDRGEDEAYSMAVAGRSYAVYFPGGGSVGLDISGAGNSFTVQWLDIMASSWLEAETVQADSEVRLTAPGAGQWAVLVKPL